MQIVRISNSTGIDDLKLIGETEAEKIFIKQLSEAGTLISVSSVSSGSAIFRASVTGTNQQNTLISSGRIGKVDFTIRQNANFIVDLKFVSAGEPMDLTEYTAIKLDIRKEKHAPVAASLNLTSGLSISGDDDNILKIQLSPQHTSVLCHDSYYYDIMFVKPGSNNYYVEGKLYINRTVTS